MKVKIQINGQTYEKEIDDSNPVRINVSSGNGAADSDFFDISATPQPGKPRKEYRTFVKHWYWPDTIQREITYDDEGNIIDIQDRNLDAEARAERRRLNKIKNQLEWKKAPLWIKLLAVLVVSAPLLFFLYIILTT